MNRIRKLGAVFQVLITPSIKVSPDSSIMVGNWEDDELQNFYVLEFPTLGNAKCEALKHPDIDWYRLVLNHKYIFQRLENTVRSVVNDQGMTVEFIPKLMSPETLKNTMFDRVMKDGDRFNLRYGASDIISFTIVNPWTKNLFKIAKALENHRAHPYRDDLRIREKRLTDGKIISLLGVTEFGTIYEIKLIPTLLHQWSEWNKKTGYLKQEKADKLYEDMLKKQDETDKLVIR